MRASRLSSVRMRGLEMMRSMPARLGRREAHAEVDGVVDRAEREADRATASGADRGRAG